MRIYLITLLLLFICPLTSVCFADDKSDCLNQCANDKRDADMFCPPAGGYTDEDRKQCLAKNTSDFTGCTKVCSPPADQQSTPTELPAKSPDESVATDKPY